jgi:hypothetical protein
MLELALRLEDPLSLGEKSAHRVSICMKSSQRLACATSKVDQSPTGIPLAYGSPALENIQHQATL